MKIPKKAQSYSTTLILLFLISQGTYRALYPMGAPQAAAGVASVAAVLGAPLRVLLTALNAAREGKNILRSINECIHDLMPTEFWDSSSPSIKDPEKTEREDEEKLHNNPSLRATQQQLIEKALNLLLTAYCPSAHPCDRIKSLFAVNRIKVLGFKGRVFRECLATLNRHHFCFDGTLKGYDPSMNNNKQPKRIQELAAFLKTVCSSKEEYLGYLKRGIDLGISFTEQYENDQHENFAEKSEPFVWKFTAEILRKMTGFDISAFHKVEPAIVLAHKTNRNFLKVIQCCSSESGQYQFNAAKELIEQHRVKHNGALCRPYEVMKRYYSEAHERLVPQSA